MTDMEGANILLLHSIQGLPWPFTVTRQEALDPNGPSHIITPFHSTGKTNFIKQFFRK